jgi:hypothetical protein
MLSPPVKGPETGVIGSSVALPSGRVYGHCDCGERIARRAFDLARELPS